MGHPDFEISVVNRSTLLTTHQVTRMVSAVDRQVRYDFSPHWGGNYKVEYDSRPEKYDWLIEIVDDSTVEGAAGWHSIRDDGRVVGQVAVNQPFPVSAVLSHEVLEMIVNQSVANTAIDWSDGLIYALEVCDPVQATTYKIDEWDVSDFVLPAWFAADNRGQDTAFKTKGLDPFEVAPGGFAIRYDQQWRDRSIGVSNISDHMRAMFLRGDEDYGIPGMTEAADLIAMEELAAE